MSIVGSKITAKLPFEKRKQYQTLNWLYRLPKGSTLEDWLTYMKYAEWHQLLSQRSKFRKISSKFYWSKPNQEHRETCAHEIQGDQDHFLPKEMLISPSILKLHKNPRIWEGLRTIHFI